LTTEIRFGNFSHLLNFEENEDCIIEKKSSDEEGGEGDNSRDDAMVTLELLQ
jgi:hypothetical protein